MAASDVESISSFNAPSSHFNNDKIQINVATMEDWNERRTRALATIDEGNFGWLHARACFVAGVGFFTDAYDLFAINLVSKMLSYVSAYDLSDNVDLGLKISTNSGALVGQLIFGMLADQLGRKKMYGIELWVIIIASISSALSAQAPSIDIFSVLIFWRIILGLGVGGDYPLSAIITSEFAATRNRGKMMAIVFSMQGFGILASALVAVITLAAARPTIVGNRDAIDTVWRIVLGMGALPGVVALYFRLTIPETPRYRIDIERDIYGVEKDIGAVGEYEVSADDGPINYPAVVSTVVSTGAPPRTVADFKDYFGRWDNGKILLGTCGAWFCIDIAFYGLGLNNSIFIRNLNLGSSAGDTFSADDAYGSTNDQDVSGSEAYSALWSVAIANVYLTVLGTIPGYWFTIVFVDKWGRKPIQYMGFGVLTVIFLVLSSAFNELVDDAKAIYCLLFILAQFFSNFGPNSTTFIIPGEVFPTRYRSTAYGISAASGKLGAVLAQVIFVKIGSMGIGYSLLVCAIFMVFGICFTYLIPETKEKALENMTNED